MFFCVSIMNEMQLLQIAFDVDADDDGDEVNGVFSSQHPLSVAYQSPRAVLCAMLIV